jgi:ribosomal protein S20
MADTIKEAMLEQDLNTARLALTYAKTAIRNALTSIEDGDVEEAVNILTTYVEHSTCDEY